MYSISSSHPALKGHFPGNPIVPGVIILNYVLRHVQQNGYKATMLDNVKFLTPLLPDQRFEIVLQGGAPVLAFQVLVGQKTVVKGKIRTELT